MKIITVIFCSFLFVVSASAQTKVPVKFANGLSETTVHGRLTGFRYVDYMVAAKGGQTLSVKLSASNENSQFYIYDKAMIPLEGSAGFGDFSGILPADGNYTIRVLLPRSAARRKGAATKFSVKIEIKQEKSNV